MLRWLSLLLLFATPAAAQMPTCEPATSVCEESWVEDGTITTIRLKPAAQDFVSEYGGANDRTFTFVTSDRQPTLRDFDGDGRIDVGLFERVGMVNGDYYLFRRTDVGFVLWGILNGDQFTQDQSGFLVANGRSSCCERGLSFHVMAQTDLPALFSLHVRPEELVTDVPQCELTTDGSEEDIRRNHGPMIAAYCRQYEDDAAVDDRTIADLRVSTATQVDSTTILACNLDNGGQVRLSEDRGILTYTYGKPGDAPELTCDVPLDTAKISTEDGSGPNRYAYVELPRGNYVYRLEQGHRLPETNGGPVSDVFGHLSVRSPDGAVVFDRPCDPRRLFAAIHRLPAR